MERQIQRINTQHKGTIGKRVKSLSHGCLCQNHGGQQKSFVEQLIVDLQGENITCFFDKDPQSLPKGEDFSSRIFETAQKCRIAFVILWDEFISSKWPIHEFCDFVKTKNSADPKLKILTLFFGLLHEALSQKLQKKDSLKRLGQRLLKPHKKLTNLNESMNALEVLRRINGVNVIEQEGDVTYRAKILGCILSLLPPNLKHDESYVQCKERVCQAVAGLCKNTECKKNGIKIAGFYSVGSIGKTTLSRVACNFYSNDFDGRVLQIELGKRMPIETLAGGLRISNDALKTLVNFVTNTKQ